MQSFSTCLGKYLRHRRHTSRNFDTPGGIVEYCQLLRELWIPLDVNGDKVASIFFDHLVKEMCDSIRLLGGTPQVIPQSISSVDEGMRAIDLIVEWCESNGESNPEDQIVALPDSENIAVVPVKKKRGRPTIPGVAERDKKIMELI